MTKRQIEDQKKWEAYFTALKNRKKEKAMQARTGAVSLNSSFGNIQAQLKQSLNTYGHITDVNKGITFQDPDHLEAA